MDFAIPLLLANKALTIHYNVMLHPLSESPEWLKVFSCDFANWSGLSLSSEAEVNSRLRGVIAEKRPSLIEMRNYLFSRQCAMLLKVHKPWEVRMDG